MKLHISMRVEDIQRATHFYSTLFKAKPVIEKEEYVKWDVEDPSVNFVIEKGCCGSSKPGFDHIGIQVYSDDELEDVSNRFEDSGNAFLGVEPTTCCFAKSDKAWVKGASGENWETFLTHSHDEIDYGTDRTDFLDACCK